MTTTLDWSKLSDPDYTAGVYRTKRLLDAAAFGLGLARKDAGPTGMALEDSERLSASLSAYMREAWHVLEPHASFAPNWHLDAIAEHLTAVTRGEIRDLIMNIPPRCTKALDVNTPILTTWGWKRHGDLRPGDFVFSPAGMPVRVTGVTPPILEDACEVSFDDGVSIVAGAGHLWEVERDNCDSPRLRRRTVVTTTELRTSEGKQRADCIRVALPPEMAPQELLVDPYLLGVWLGDGDSGGGSFGTSHQDVEGFRHLGVIAATYPPGGTRLQPFYRIRVPGLATRLRVMGLTHNKHIPEPYLLASVEQRRSLLQGLMDTDGMACARGYCSFSNKNARLANQVRRLVASLGYKTTISSHMTELNGKMHGPHYVVCFTPDATDHVFRLHRKQERVKRAKKNMRSRRRYVTSLVGVGLRFVNCIEVEGSLYLAGEHLVTTHNSLSVSVLWMTWEWTRMPWTQWMFSTYVDRLAIRDSVKCRRLIQSPWYQERWGHLFQLAGDQNAKTRFDNNRGGYRLTSSVAGSVTGEGANRLVLDDPHDPQGAESAQQRETTLRWIDETWSTRRNNPITDARVVMMQRLHQQDATGHILANQDGWDHLMLPMRFDPRRRCVTSIGWSDPRSVDGELLHPERFPEPVVRQIEKSLGPYGVAGQMQQEPTARSGGQFERAWFITDRYDRVPPGSQMIWVRAWDAAGTEGGGAYTAGLLMGLRVTDGLIFIKHVVRGQWGAANRNAIIIGAAQDDTSTFGNQRAVLYRFEQEPGSGGKDQAKNLVRLLAGYRVEAEPSSGDKFTRADPFAGACKNGDVHVLPGAWREAYLDEMEAAGPGAAFLDQMDVSSSAYNRLQDLWVRVKATAGLGVNMQALESAELESESKWKGMS